VDINPGDRANTCKGVLRPTGVTSGGKKGYVIEYTCEKCGARMRNKAAVDDNFEELLKVSSAQDIIKR
jgi:hypothetical protein